MKSLSHATWEGSSYTCLVVLVLSMVANLSGTLRTFPHHAFFMDGQGIGQENLFNVLKAYSLYVFAFNKSRSSLNHLERYDPDVGYCQGLPFVVAILLLNVCSNSWLLLIRWLTSPRCQMRRHSRFSSD